MTHFHEEILHLKSLLTEMAAHAERQVGDSIRAVVERDSDLARLVIERDRTIDNFEIEVDEMVVQLLACYQPMAVDLRMIINGSKISEALERIGDLAVNNAQGALYLNPYPPMGPAAEMARLARMSQSMIHDAIVAFANNDPALARDVCRRDDEVDDLKDQIHEVMIGLMKQDPSIIEPGVSMILVVRNLERMGDLATNLCEDVVHLVEGVNIKHHHEEELHKQA